MEPVAADTTTATNYDDMATATGVSCSPSSIRFIDASSSSYEFGGPDFSAGSSETNTPRSDKGTPRY